MKTKETKELIEKTGSGRYVESREQFDTEIRKQTEQCTDDFKSSEFSQNRACPVGGRISHAGSGLRSSGNDDAGSIEIARRLHAIVGEQGIVTVPRR